MKKIPFFEASVTKEVKLSVSTVSGQLIVSQGVPYIVVTTRDNESYEDFIPGTNESTGTHYKIGGFIKVQPHTIRYLNPETEKMEDIDWFKEKIKKEGK